MHKQINFLFLITIIFIIGIIFGYYVSLPETFLLSVVCFFILLLILTLIFSNKFSSHILIFILFILVFFVGWFKITVDNRAPEKNILEKLFEHNSNIVLSGIVTERPRSKNDRLSFTVDTKKIYINNRPINLETTTLLSLQIDTTNYTYKDIRYGDELFALGKLVEPTGQRNPGEFDYSRYLHLNGIYSTFRVKGYESVIARSNNNGNFIQLKIIQPAREYIKDILHNNMGKIEAAFLSGLLVGDRADIPEDIKQDFFNAGVTHILAVSGLNVAFVIVIITILFSLLIKNKYLKNGLIIISLIFYLLLTGGQPSIVRATIMGIVFIIGNSLERNVLPLHSLSLSALIVLVYNSKQLFDVGFQLSFLCVFALIYVYPILSGLVKLKSKRKIFLFLKESLLCSIAVMIILFPVLALVFGKVSFVAVFANIVVVPIANVCLCIGFLQVLTYSILPYISNLFTELNQFLLWLNLKIINCFGSLEPLIISSYGFTIAKLFVYYCFCFFSLHTIKNKKIGLTIIGILLLLSINVYLNIFNNNGGKLRITFIDVGQGDATLIQMSNDRNIMVDAGPVTENFDSGEKIIYPFLLRESVDKINLFFLSHFHDDHFGGLPYLIKQGMIDTIYFYDSTGNGIICNYLDSLSSSHGTIFKQVNFSNYTIDGLKIITLNTSLDQNYNLSKNKRENNLSLILKVYYGNTSILFTGDIEKEADKALCEKYDDFLKSDILKVAHHGSNSGTGEEFLSYVNPKQAVVFAGRRNVYKFPSPVVINRLLSKNCNVNVTADEGAIIFEITKDKFEKIKWK